jgi:hypothetical protein
MIVDRVGDQYSARLSQRLQPRRYVHPIPEDVVLLNDHVTEVDADAEVNSPLWQGSLIALGHPALDLNGAPDGIDHAGELGKQAVAGVLNDPPRCSAVFRLTNSRRWAWSPSCVPSSSPPISPTSAL